MTPEQSLQVWLTGYLLDRRHRRGTMLAQRNGIRFFREWSAIVRGNLSSTPWCELDGEVLNDLTGDKPSRRSQSVSDGEATPDLDLAEHLAGKNAANFQSMFEHMPFRPFLELLADRDIAALMSFEFPELETTERISLTEAPLLIREAVARSLEIPMEELAEADFARVTHLDLSGAEIVDIAPIAGLNSLQTLDLNDTQVADIAPLEKLTNLTQLYVGTGQFQQEQLDALRRALPNLNMVRA